MTIIPIMISRPYVAGVARDSIDEALHANGLPPLKVTYGVHWYQCMDRRFAEIAYHTDHEWILTVESDSMITAEDVAMLLEVPDIHDDVDCVDCVAALKPKRAAMEMDGVPADDGYPLRYMQSSHFGLTLIRVQALKRVPRPWFPTRADDEGGYTDARLDPDMMFWKGWRMAGNSLYTAMDVRMGHLCPMIARFSRTGEVQYFDPIMWSRLLSQESEESAVGS